ASAWAPWPAAGAAGERRNDGLSAPAGPDRYRQFLFQAQNRSNPKVDAHREERREPRLGVDRFDGNGESVRLADRLPGAADRRRVSVLPIAVQDPGVRWPLWQEDVPGAGSGPAVGDGTVFVPALDGNLDAVPAGGCGIDVCEPA